MFVASIKQIVNTGVTLTLISDRFLLIIFFEIISLKMHNNYLNC